MMAYWVTAHDLLRVETQPPEGAQLKWKYNSA
jgi:hypothetical protein